MKIEIKEYYPVQENIEKDWFTGTIRVLFVEHNIEMLGISVEKKKDRYFLMYPGRVSWDTRKKQNVWYPYFSFVNNELSLHEISDIIKKDLPKFMEKWLIDHGKKSATVVEVKKEIKEFITPPPLKVRKRNDLRNNTLSR